MIATCRRRAPCATDSVPTTSGDTRTASGTPRAMARASSRVISLDAEAIPGMPVVSVFPGSTISRFEPMLANWSTT